MKHWSKLSIVWRWEPDSKWTFALYTTTTHVLMSSSVDSRTGTRVTKQEFLLVGGVMAQLWQYFMTCCCLTTPKLVWLTKTAVKHNENGIPSLQQSSKVMMWCVKLLLVNFVLIATVVFVKLTKLILIYPLKMSKVDCLRMLE